MQRPRWYFVLLVVLTINVALVLSTSLWHVAVADEPLPSVSEIEEDAETELTETPLPSSLLEVPSLADRKTIEQDPYYQEFEKLFSGSGNASSLSVLGNTGIAKRSDRYFATLDERLLTANRLTAAARSIAQEAAKLTREGKSSSAKRLLEMSTQLREITADLLVFEL